MYYDRKIVYREAYHWSFVISLLTNFLGGSHLISGLLFYFLSLHQMTSLHLAAKSGCIKILNFLVGQRGDINIQDNNGVITSKPLCANKY